MSDREWTIRPREHHAQMIAVVDTPDLLVEEICATCLKQGVLWHVHGESEAHQGSPHFKPSRVTPETLRALADQT